jgi:hypothetical protein
MLLGVALGVLGLAKRYIVLAKLPFRQALKG